MFSYILFACVLWETDVSLKHKKVKPCFVESMETGFRTEQQILEFD